MAGEHDLMNLDELLEDRQGFIAKRLGRYELCFELASGGMATVYLARMIAPDDASLERLVALKLIHRHLAKEASFREMFLDEARIVSRINHPNVCTVYDFGEERGIHYIAMELLEGESLYTITKSVAKMSDAQRPKLWPAYCARIVADAAEGLHAAHESKGARGEPLQIVHRDVSPQNIFVNFDGSVRVVDFGIARAIDRQHHTTTGALKGKFNYLAPEQITSHTYDRRVDIWALGVVLWEILTRKRLFRRETEFATIDAVRTMPIRPPSEVAPSVPKELDPIVMKALERTPSKRYATARELGRDLRKFLMSMSEPVEMAEVAEFMRSSFAEEYASRRTLMEIALAGATRSVPQVGRVGGERSGTHDAITAIKAVADGSKSDEAAEPAPVEEGPAPPAPIEAPPAPAPRSASRAFVIGAAVFAVVGLGLGAALGLTLAGGSEEGEPDDGLAAVTPAQAVDAPPTARGARPETPARAASSASDTPPATPAPAAQVEAPAIAAVVAPPAPAAETAVAPAPVRPERTARAASPSRAVRPAPARPAAPAEPGTVIIVSSPGWGIVEDRQHRRLGETLQPLSLPAGAHRLYVRRMGVGDPVPVDVRVEPGQTTRRTVRFPD